MKDHEPGRGYSLPYCVKMKEQLTILFGCPAAVAFLYWRASSSGAMDGEMSWMFRLLFGILLAVSAWEGQQMLWKVHFVPEGIAVTLGPWTLRRIPVEEIRLLCGVLQTQRSKNRTICTYWIAVSTRSREEIAKQQDDKFGCFSEEIRRKVARHMDWNCSFIRGLDLRILWLEYERERLEVLRSLYPQAQWLDCSEGRIFDAPASIFRE